LLGAEASRDVLLHGDRAQIPLGLGVVTWHGTIMQEREDSLFLLGEAIQHITSRAVFGCARLWLLRRRSERIGLRAFCKELVVAT
jgi:hypothetical protein